jgi:hypothetical protein
MRPGTAGPFVRDRNGGPECASSEGSYVALVPYAVSAPPLVVLAIAMNAKPFLRDLLVRSLCVGMDPHSTRSRLPPFPCPSYTGESAAEPVAPSGAGGPRLRP